MIFWIFYKLLYRKKMEYIVERFLITSAMTLQFFLSPILNVLSDFLNCTKINEDYYLSNYLIEKCNDNPTYNAWALFFVLPCFCIFVIVLPIFSLYYMFTNRKQLFHDRFIYKIGFLLNGYSSYTFYW